MARTQQLGKDAETIAAHYLQNKLFELVRRNYACKSGEIDLIMQDRQYLVFVEVRMRSNPNFGGGLASVDFRKQKRLIKAAQHYLLYKPWQGPCRFDVIAVDKRGQCHWVENAFGTS